MKKLFLKLIGSFNGSGEISEAVMYSGGELSKIVLETDHGKYAITILKEKETDGNS